MVHEVRREEGLEPWPRPFDLVVEFSEDDVVDLWFDGLDRLSEAEYCWCMSTD